MWWGQLTPMSWTSYSPLLSFDDPVDDAARVGGQCSFGGLVGRCPADDHPRPLAVVRGDLADLLGRGRCATLEGDHRCRRRRRGSRAVGRITMTWLAVMVVPFTVPSTSTVSPFLTALAEVELVPFVYFVEDAVVDGDLLTR